MKFDLKLFIQSRNFLSVLPENPTSIFRRFYPIDYVDLQLTWYSVNDIMQINSYIQLSAFISIKIIIVILINIIILPMIPSHI